MQMLFYVSQDWSGTPGMDSSHKAGLLRGLKPVGVPLSNFCSGLFFPRSLAQTITTDQLRGALWAPVNLFLHTPAQTIATS